MPQPETLPPRPSVSSILEGTRFASKGEKKTKLTLGEQLSAPTVEDAAHELKTPEEPKSLTELKTAVGDVFRDIGTANRMAKERFEGDSALMRTARGFITTGVGLGLEKSMDFVWDKVWQGDIPFYDKSKFGEGMAEAMNKFARSSDLNARLYFLMKEATQDLSLAIFYNFLAFRSQPLLEKSKPQHLISSLTADIVAAAALPSLPKDMKRVAGLSSHSMMDKQIDALEEKMSFINRSYFDKANNEMVHPNRLRTEEIKQRIKRIKAEKGKIKIGKEPKIGKVENFFLNAFHISNPVVYLGADMIGSGVTTLIKNYREVRHTRQEKGGLNGKEVYMPKREDQGGHKQYEQRKPYEQRKTYEPRKPEYDRNEPKKVYYGQSSRDDLKKLEEYDLKGGL